MTVRNIDVTGCKVSLCPAAAAGCDPPGQGVTGYGSKITTRYMVQVRNEFRWRRVYATCFSNCATFWIIFNRQKFHVDNLEKELEA